MHIPSKVCFIFQTYRINIEEARNCSREEITEFSFVLCSNRRPWNKIVAAQAALPLLKPAESHAVALQERFQLYHAWITSWMFKVNVTSIANYEPLGRRRLFGMKARRHFSEVALVSVHLCPCFPEQSSTFFPYLSKWWCVKWWSGRWAYGYK